ncbi:hypothetical protein HF086_005861 [Spodoptera exigua]|uniref:Peptidase aspartic putative domain-containing protein n=1 Tax=Spodoptera exigua TaxID=7107 RepID=A0A922MGI4_SPOEX|nr:hypothetical protein HF086_005861 [Spodoptera exigua]
MDTLISQLPRCTFNKPTWAHLAGIQLADPEYNVSRPIDILLGADVYSHIILEGIIRADLSLPVAQQTQLGWILCGNFNPFHCNVVLNQVDELQRFWENEDISESSNLSAEDLQCIEFYKNTTTRHENGMYEVRLPFQENFETRLGMSKNKAMAQFQQLERKFHNNEELAKQYKLFIQEYKTLGHMIPASGNMQPDYYLPHHCVLRNDSTTTALRVVFNASAKTTTGTSLNDVMLKGPNLQQDLQSLLLRWRQYRVAFTADIEKMYRFIWINKQDQKFQKIIWRDTIDMRHQVYQLCTVTYGTKAAPFLAMMTLKQLAEDERHNYDSVAIKALEQSFYMDDVLHGSHSVELAAKLKQDLITLLKSGGFKFKKMVVKRLERWLGTAENNTIELHGFCDSSNKAYACVVYSKTENNEVTKISLVAGKARLAPVNKSISLPRLELCGALLLAKLLSKIQQCLISHNIKIYTWTDSKVVLAWLQGEPGRWKPFVANRVRQISNMLPTARWRYVKSGENPADCASRGLGIDQLKNHSLWWEGPSWLQSYDPDHETEQAVFTTDEEARINKKNLFNHISQQESDNFWGKY